MPFPSAFGESQKRYDDIFDDFKRLDQKTYGEKRGSDSNYFQNPVSGYHNQNLYGPLITILLVAFAIILICEWFIVIDILLLRSKEQGDFRISLVLLGVNPLRHVAQWVSRAPTHNSLPAFRNLNGIYMLFWALCKFFNNFIEVFIFYNINFFNK